MRMVVEVENRRIDRSKARAGRRQRQGMCIRTRTANDKKSRTAAELFLVLERYVGYGRRRNSQKLTNRASGTYMHTVHPPPTLIYLTGFYWRNLQAVNLMTFITYVYMM